MISRERLPAPSPAYLLFASIFLVMLIIDAFYIAYIVTLAVHGRIDIALYGPWQDSLVFVPWLAGQTWFSWWLFRMVKS